MQEITDASNFLIQYLKDSGFEGDIENGTAIHDLLIKPMAILYTLFKDTVDKSYGYLSLKKAQEALTGTEYDAAIDCILSNWFVTRGTGDNTSGIIRAYFSEPLTSIYIDPISMFTVDELETLNTSPKLYRTSDFETFYNTVRNVTEYYIDIPVRSTVPTDQVITTGSVVTGTVNSLFYVRAEVLTVFTPGNAPETSSAFIDRTQKVITTRELVSDRAITTVLLDAFPSIQRIYVAGYGAEEQMRDLVDYGGLNLHIGNKVDIYLQTKLAKKTLETSESSVTLDFVKIISVKVNNVAIVYTVLNNTISFTATGTKVITYLQSGEFTSAKNYFAGNIVCCDSQIFQPEIVILEFEFDAQLSNPSVNLDTVKTNITNYICGLSHPANYSALDLVNVMKPGITDITFPFTVTSNGVAFTGTDSNIKQLYTDNDYITINTVA
jgi:hypothetical protein